MAQNDYPSSPQTSPTRLKERVGYNRTEVHAVLDEAVLCHVGFVVDGRPVVLPHLHARVADRLYLHGSSAARFFRSSATGEIPVCVTVTLVDGLVLARSAFHHSVNYRSVVIHGMAREVTAESDKKAALATLVDAVVPGRSAAVRGPSRKELAATSVLRLDLESVSIKSRTGPPQDDASDLALPYWAGVLPVKLTAGNPEPADDLVGSPAIPAHVGQWQRPASR